VWGTYIDGLRLAGANIPRIFSFHGAWGTYIDGLRLATNVIPHHFFLREA